MATTVSFKKPKPVDGAPVAAPVAAPAAAPAAAVPTATPQPAPSPTATTAAAPAPSPTATSAPPENNKVVTNDHYKGVGAFEGEFSSKDMATPYLTIMQKQSKNFDEHMAWLGQWVYDKETTLGDEIRVVFIRASKYYKEDVPFGSPDIPQRFTEIAAARAAGFNDGQLKEAADLDLLIEVDATLEGVGDLAHIIVGDKGYILARYTVQSTAYGKTVGILAKDSGSFLKGNLINGFYKLSTLKRSNAETSWFIPVLKTDGRTTEELKTQIIERMSIG